MREVSSADSRPLPIVSSASAPTDDEGVRVRESVSRVANPIFEAALVAPVPSEALSNTGGIAGLPVRKLWRPNNYRREISTRRVADTGSVSCAGGYRLFDLTKKRLLLIRDYPNVLLIHGREKTLAVWSQNIVAGEKETFLLESDSYRGIEEAIRRKREEIRARLDGALEDFADRMSVAVPGAVPVWAAAEDWTKTEDYKARLPPSCIVYEEAFKKVYRDGVEFTGGHGEVPGQKMLNFHRNLALLQLSPEIEGELFALRKSVDALRKDFGQIKFVAVEDGKAPASRGQKRLSGWFD